ncbi:MAG: thioesterase family protein [Nocardioidaceae bacterium]|nr:thioesterase family protein [Nocardioidaceae bacterium]
MASEFDQHTALEEIGAGTYRADLRPGWAVGAGLNGGYLLAVLGNAVRAASPGKPDPLAVSAHYLSAATAGPATVATRVVRDGGSVATFAAELRQGDVPRVSVLATYGDLAARPDEVSTTAEPPALPDVEECPPSTLAPPEFLAAVPLLERFDLRLDPACLGWVFGEPSGRGMLQGWLRLADGREPDPILLLSVVDVLPPVTFDLGRPGWAPTVELTAHIRALPAPGWLRVRASTSNLAGGMFEEDCEVWDSSGRLVAQSRQLARQPR